MRSDGRNSSHGFSYNFIEVKSISIFRNRFISVRIMVDPKPIPGTLGTRLGWDIIPSYSMHSHIFWPRGNTGQPRGNPHGRKENIRKYTQTATQTQVLTLNRLRLWIPKMPHPTMGRSPKEQNCLSVCEGWPTLPALSITATLANYGHLCACVCGRVLIALFSECVMLFHCNNSNYPCL